MGERGESGWSFVGVVVRAALLAFLLVGGPIGLSSLAAPFTGRPVGLAHRLQHVHLQVWAFLGGFVLAAGFRVLPQLAGRRRTSDRIPVLCAFLFSGAVGLWVLVPPFALPEPDGWAWAILAGGILEMTVWTAYATTLLATVVRAEKKGPWQPVAGAGLLVLGLSAAASSVGWISTTRLLIAPAHAWIRVGYTGFLFAGVPLLALGISGRVLRKEGDPVAPYLLGALLVTGATAAFAGLLPWSWAGRAGIWTFAPGFVLLAWGLRLDQAPTRLNIPGFVHGVIAGFAFVGVFLVLSWLRVVHRMAFLPRDLVHVWALGFLSILIVAYGSWILPSAAGRVPINSRALPVAIWVIACGTIARVVAPEVVSWFPAVEGATAAVALGGGLLQYVGVASFAVALWPHLPPVRR